MNKQELEQTLLTKNAKFNKIRRANNTNNQDLEVVVPSDFRNSARRRKRRGGRRDRRSKVLKKGGGTASAGGGVGERAMVFLPPIGE
jgi:hypothetical protein